MVAELLAAAEAASASRSWEGLRAKVDAVFDEISPEDVSELQIKVAGQEAGPAADLAAAIRLAAEARMGRASKLIADLIDTADGDINQNIRKCLKQEANPLPLLMVLQLNIAEAQMDGEEDKMRVLMHIYTVMNEELEKKSSRVNALISKLMRMEEPGIRNNLLRHHLTPVEVAAAAPDMDDGVPGGAPLMAALVPPAKLAAGIAELVGNVDRQMRAAVGEHDETRFETLEKIRLVAKEARAIVGELYGEGELNEFGAALTPAFTALMAYKQREAATAAAPGAGAESQDAPAAAAPGR